MFQFKPAVKKSLGLKMMVLMFRSLLVIVRVRKKCALAMAQNDQPQ